MKIISIDFDGVINNYASGWQGADVIPDPPVPGAIEWLESLCRDGRFDVQIFSSRSHQGGMAMMAIWLTWNGLPGWALNKIGFPLHKPSAHLTIDDRAFCFRGEFPEPDEIDQFKPWWS